MMVPLPVHPRSRGKYPGLKPSRRARVGSSPLAREIRQHHDRVERLRRFIPARAGNTADSRADADAIAVHPRSRGKYRVVDVYRVLQLGSSPLAREIRNLGRGRRRLPRFIPARAGNTSVAGQPRGCLHGSSPLAREIRPRQHAERVPRRFIPARAGNTVGPLIHSAQYSVHPRSCGKYCSRPRRL